MLCMELSIESAHTSSTHGRYIIVSVLAMVCNALWMMNSSKAGFRDFEPMIV